MLDTPQIVQVSARQTAVIRLTIPRAEIQQVMGPGFGELMGAVTAQGIGPDGPLYSHHFRMDPDVFDFEIGVAVRAPVQPVGRVQPGQLPAARVARTIYRGPYEGLGAAWAELCSWLEAQGLPGQSNLWESYLTGPDASPDPATWQTELNRPLAD